MLNIENIPLFLLCYWAMSHTHTHITSSSPQSWKFKYLLIVVYPSNQCQLYLFKNVSRLLSWQWNPQVEGFLYSSQASLNTQLAFCFLCCSVSLREMKLNWFGVLYIFFIVFFGFCTLYILFILFFGCKANFDLLEQTSCKKCTWSLWEYQ